MKNISRTEVQELRESTGTQGHVAWGKVVKYKPTSKAGKEY